MGVLEPQALVGGWRRFGLFGPVYQIVASGLSSAAGEPVMRVRVVETGEEVDYPPSEILDDPRER